MISTKGRYAVRVMLDLAQHPESDYIPLKDIAERQEISKKYLEIIAKELVRGEFLTGVSGKGGGYKLLRRPEEYNIGEILEFMEGTLASVACLREDAPPCPRAETCKTLPMWQAYDAIAHDYFYQISLADLLKDRPAEQSPREDPEA